jgi:hypothetical protein
VVDGDSNELKGSLKFSSLSNGLADSRHVDDSKIVSRARATRPGTWRVVVNGPPVTFDVKLLAFDENHRKSRRHIAVVEPQHPRQPRHYASSGD